MYKIVYGKRKPEYRETKRQVFVYMRNNIPNTEWSKVKVFKVTKGIKQTPVSMSCR